MPLYDTLLASVQHSALPVQSAKRWRHGVCCQLLAACPQCSLQSAQRAPLGACPCRLSRAPTPEHEHAAASAAAAPQQALQAVFDAAEPPQQRQRASATATGLGHVTGAAQQPGQQAGQQQAPKVQLAAARRSGYWPPDAEEAEAVGSRCHLAAITAAALERRPYLYAAALESKNPTMLKEVWTPPQHLHLDRMEAPLGFTQPQLALLHGQIHAHTQLLLQLHAIAHGAPGLQAIAEFTGILLKELQVRQACRRLACWPRCNPSNAHVLPASAAAATSALSAGLLLLCYLLTETALLEFDACMAQMYCLTASILLKGLKGHSYNRPLLHCQKLVPLCERANGLPAGSLLDGPAGRGSLGGHGPSTAG